MDGIISRPQTKTILNFRLLCPCSLNCPFQLVDHTLQFGLAAAAAAAAAADDDDDDDADDDHDGGGDDDDISPFLVTLH